MKPGRQAANTDLQASTAEQYDRMLRKWDAYEERYRDPSRVPSAPIDDLPPIRWARDDHITAVMTARFGDRYTEYRRLFNLARAKQVTPDHPIHLDFDLMDYCNLACQNCTENFRDWSRTVLDLPALMADPFFAKRKLYAANVGNAAEPFLRPELALDLIRFLRANDIIDIFIHTNALLLKPAIIDRLIDHEVSWVSVSTDAFSDETFRVTRGKRIPQQDSGYQQVVDTVHALLERRRERGSDLPFVRMSFLVVPENYHEMRAFHDYWAQHVDMVEFQHYVAPNPVGVHREPYVMRTGLFEQIADAQCGMPFYRMSVHPDGTVGPCCSSYGHCSELLLGRLGETTIEDMWNGDTFRRIREQHLRPDGPAELPTCVQCLEQNYQFKHYGPNGS